MTSHLDMKSMLLEAHRNLGRRSVESNLRPRLKHIMIIADEPEFAESLQIDLHSKGHQASVINDGLRGLLTAKRIATDLVIVGWAPPRLSGLDVCRRLRTGLSEAPIILLTQADSAEERIAGLEAGADDCISMPIDPEELVARIHASLQRRTPATTETTILQCADIQLNRKTREVFRGMGAAAPNGKQLIRLTAKEFDLLEYLMNHYFQVLTRAQILENVWGYEYTGSSNIIEVYIRYLRRKLETQGADRLIHTVRGVGYIFREENAS